MHAFAGGYEAGCKSRILASLTFNLSYKFRFTVAFVVLMLDFRLTFSCSHYKYSFLCSIGRRSAPTINLITPCLVFVSEIV